MFWTSNKNEELRNAPTFWTKALKQRAQMRNIGVDGRITLKW